MKTGVGSACNPMLLKPVVACCLAGLGNLRQVSTWRPLRVAALHAVPNEQPLQQAPAFHDFLKRSQVSSSKPIPVGSTVPYLNEQAISNVQGGKIYLESYGCQMNVNDLEVVLAILKEAGYSEIVQFPEESNIILINTCAIRENAEHKIWHRLNYFKYIKSTWKKNAKLMPDRPPVPPKVAVLGCMAERLKEKLIDADKMVDVVCGPDAYRDLPRLLAIVDEGQTAINTLLSLEETYADVSPVRISKNSVTAFVSIMRGCNNMCSYCIVPFTRGRERSRPVDSIIREVGELWDQGVKEVTLLGQNVNSYNDESVDQLAETVGTEENQLKVGEELTEVHYKSDGKYNVKYFQSSKLSPGFSTLYRTTATGLRFHHLLDRLSECFPEMRFRFTSPHPKDFPDELIYLMRDRPNICKNIHLPAQSGSTRVLERMRRGYTREAYLQLVERIRNILPDVGLSSDFIAGYCGETEEDHLETLSLIEAVGYDMAYMFSYSMREKTHAHRHHVDDVPEDVKQRRLSELITTFRRTTVPGYQCQIGTKQLVLVEGPNKRAPDTELIGRNDRGQRVIFANMPMPKLVEFKNDSFKPSVELATSNQFQPTVDTQAGPTIIHAGDYVEVEIQSTTLASLQGKLLGHSSIRSFCGFKHV